MCLQFLLFGVIHNFCWCYQLVIMSNFHLHTEHFQGKTGRGGTQRCSCKFSQLIRWSGIIAGQDTEHFFWVEMSWQSKGHQDENQRILLFLAGQDTLFFFRWKLISEHFLGIKMFLTLFSGFLRYIWRICAWRKLLLMCWLLLMTPS